MPQQTIGSGVNVRCLINPNIRVNGLIELNQASVFRTVLGNNDIAMTQGASLTRTTTETSPLKAPLRSLPVLRLTAFILSVALCTLATQGARRGTWI
jgi:hypothetical protein